MYHHGVLGGTFDHLHTGHKKLLDFAAQNAERLTVGLTTDAFVQSKSYASLIEPYADRYNVLLKTLQEIAPQTPTHIVAINDVYGTTLTEPSLDLLIATRSTTTGAERINNARVSQGQRALPILYSPMVVDESDDILSSTHLRAGIVSRTGSRKDRLFLSDRLLTASARDFFQRPLGEVVLPEDLACLDPSTLFLVGDVVTDTLLRARMSFRRAFIDGRSKREPYTLAIPSRYTADADRLKNPAGMITHNVAEYLLNLSDEQNVIVTVDGEEDLIAVAAVLLLPLESSIIYGYPYWGGQMRRLRATEEQKQLFTSAVQD